MTAKKAATPKAEDDGGKATLRKLRALYEKQREITDRYFAEMKAIGEEVERILHGGPSIGTILLRLYTAYDTAWCVRYAHGKKDQYRFNHTFDVPHLKTFIKTIGVEEIELRFIAYLQDDDAFLEKERHPFSLFVRNVNKYVSDGGALPLDAPVLADCVREGKHIPPCTSDQEHTKRKMSDMRIGGATR